MPAEDDHQDWPPEAPTEEQLLPAKEALFVLVKQKLQEIVTTPREKEFLETLEVKDLRIIMTHKPDAAEALKQHCEVALGERKQRQYPTVLTTKFVNEFVFKPKCSKNLICSLQEVHRQAIAAYITTERWAHFMDALGGMRAALDEAPDPDGPPQETPWTSTVTVVMRSMKPFYKSLLQGEIEEITEEDDEME